eukprot:SAG31_NODE_98_length_25640_cov_9.936744_9_plen_69_part_00
MPARPSSWSAVRSAKLGCARLSFLSAAAMRFEHVLSNMPGEVADSFVLPHQQWASEQQLKFTAAAHRV